MFLRFKIWPTCVVLNSLKIDNILESKSLSNTYLHINLEQNALAVQNLAQMCSFKILSNFITFWNQNLFFN